MRQFSFIRMTEYENFPWKITKQYFPKKNRKVICPAAPKQYSLILNNYWKITKNWDELMHTTGDEELKKFPIMHLHGPAKECNE